MSRQIIDPAVPLRQQPQTPQRINRANPLGAKVIEHISLRGDNRTVVSGAAVTMFNGTTQVTTKGKSLRGNATGGASVALDLSKYGQITVAFWLYWDTYANDDALAMEFGPNTNSNSGNFYLDPNSGVVGGSWAVVMNAASTISQNTFPRPTAGAWHRIAVTLNIANPGFTFNVDSISVASNQGALSTGTTAFANTTLYVFSRANTGLFGTGNLQDFTIYNGILSDAEIAADYANPYQIFASPSRNIFTDSPLYPSKRVALAKQVRTTQPQNVIKVNAANPLTKNAIIFAMDSIGQSFGADTSLYATPVGNVVRSATPSGMALVTTNLVGDYISLGYRSELWSQSFTLLFVVNVFDLNSVATLFASFFNGYSSTRNVGGVQFGVYGDGSLFINKSDLVGVAGSPPNTVQPGKTANIAISQDAAGYTIMSVNGIIVFNAATTAVTFSFGNIAVLGKEIATAAEKRAGAINLFAYWPRTSPASDLASLTANPWQVFE